MTMRKLNFLGIGPRIAAVLFPFLAAAIILSSVYHDTFCYAKAGNHILLYSGIALMAAGVVFYLMTARLLLKGLRETKLMTTGPYSLCQNPLYASIILLFIPALSLLLNSWLVLITSIVGFIIFKIFIGKEYKELESVFGESYMVYRKETPELFPFPYKKWLK